MSYTFLLSQSQKEEVEETFGDINIFQLQHINKLKESILKIEKLDSTYSTVRKEIELIEQLKTKTEENLYIAFIDIDSPEAAMLEDIGAIKLSERIG